MPTTVCSCPLGPNQGAGIPFNPCRSFGPGLSDHRLGHRDLQVLPGHGALRHRHRDLLPEMQPHAQGAQGQVLDKQKTVEAVILRLVGTRWPRIHHFLRMLVEDVTAHGPSASGSFCSDWDHPQFQFSRTDLTMSSNQGTANWLVNKPSRERGSPICMSRCEANQAQTKAWTKKIRTGVLP